MRAIGLYASGNLEWVEVPKPVPSGRDLLVRVMAVAVNPVDVKQPLPAVDAAPKLLGYDVAGVVEAVGSEVSLFHVGDAVYYAGSIQRPGGFAEYHLVDERIVGPKPTTLSFAETAALALTTITAWEGLFDRLHIPPTGAVGTVLIIGAAGGVGSIACQLARRAGLIVIGTASRRESQEWVLNHGAHYVISHDQDFLPQLESLGFGLVPYIFCLNQVEPHWERMMTVLQPEGSICTILPPGDVPLAPLWSLSATLAAESMFVRPRFHTPTMIRQHQILTEVSRLIDQGELASTLSQQFAPISPDSLAEIFTRLRGGHTIGKLVASGFN